MTKGDVGSRLRTFRKKAGFTTIEVATAIGKVKQAINNWETGYSLPDILTLFSLLELYGVSLNEAFGDFVSVKEDSIDNRLLRAYHNADQSIQTAVQKLLDIDDASKKELVDKSKELA